MDDGSFEQALQVNRNLITENTLEENQQFINNVYFEYIVNDAEIPPHIEAGLWDLAGLTPWIGGSAVYTARIILGYDPDEHGVPYRLKDTSHVVKKQQEVLVYLNPANDIIVLRFRAEIESSSTFCLYDYTGKRVFSTIIPAGIKQISMNVNELSDGPYFFNIDGVGYKDSGKIRKIKQ
jgi:hypothetical protein